MCAGATPARNAESSSTIAVSDMSVCFVIYSAIASWYFASTTAVKRVTGKARRRMMKYVRADRWKQLYKLRAQRCTEPKRVVGMEKSCSMSVWRRVFSMTATASPR
ncbi:hypothetical protein BV25DRAFT_1820253 [Artomyces pyxidatus]|uniref:Uncharacterized protein n=1 Tax=Artomyces pyxidatus TaxID=48021 RepID=A0ACB8TF69_9AGAM|nr:hypothetical protein BV25DRAFT_1820253 [Artomyces pyxidatus]